MVRLVSLLILAACSRAGDQNEAKQWQDQAPPKKIEIPAGVTIAVELDGSARPPITSDTLQSVKPDFNDEERRAWLMTTLIADASPPGTVIEASTSNGVSVKIAHPTSDGLEPVLFLDRRGQLVATAVDPKEPFPRFHGKGGRLHRAGDSMPRVAPVTKLAITRPKP